VITSCLRLTATFRDLPRRTDRFTPDNGFDMTGKSPNPREQEKNTVKAMLDALKDGQRMILATGPRPRKRKAISWHLARDVTKRQVDQEGTRRSAACMVFNQITKKGRDRAMANPRQVDIAAGRGAYLARACADYLGGVQPVACSLAQNCPAPSRRVRVANRSLCG